MYTSRYVTHEHVCSPVRMRRVCAHLCACVLLRKPPQRAPNSGTGAHWSRRLSAPSSAHLVLIKDVEDKRSKLGGVSEGEELLVDLLEASSIQLPAGAVLDEALVPGQRRGQGKGALVSPTALGPGPSACLGPGDGQILAQSHPRDVTHTRPSRREPISVTRNK